MLRGLAGAAAVAVTLGCAANGDPLGSLEERLFDAPVCVGDVDRDGDTDFSDYLTLSRSYGLEGNLDADLNHDAEVAFHDYLRLSGDYGCVATGPVTPGSEPCGCLEPTASDPCDFNPEGLPEDECTVTPAQVAACHGIPSQECGFYLRVDDYRSDCSACEKNRLVGYFQTCRNMTQIARGEFPHGRFPQCEASCEFQTYVSEMRSCLQEAASDFMCSYAGGTPLTCTEVVDGVPGDVGSGIIGAHTRCNGEAGFCDLSSQSLTCFGNGLGDSWGGFCFPFGGGHSPWGSLQSVGLCHLVQQAASCAGGGLSNFVDSMCTGYQQGCLTSTPQCTLVPQDLACKLACPTTADMSFFELLLTNGGSLLATLVPRLSPTQLRQLIDLIGRIIASGPDGLLAELEGMCTDILGGRDPLPGVECDQVPPDPVRCCCDRPSGSVYWDPAVCAATGGTVVTNQCNLRNGSDALCSSCQPPRPACGPGGELSGEHYTISVDWEFVADADYDRRGVEGWVYPRDRPESTLCTTIDAQDLRTQCYQPDSGSSLSFIVPDDVLDDDVIVIELRARGTAPAVEGCAPMRGLRFRRWSNAPQLQSERDERGVCQVVSENEPLCTVAGATARCEMTRRQLDDWLWASSCNSLQLDVESTWRNYDLDADPVPPLEPLECLCDSGAP